MLLEIVKAPSTKGVNSLSGHSADSPSWPNLQTSVLLHWVASVVVGVGAGIFFSTGTAFSEGKDE